MRRTILPAILLATLLAPIGAAVGAPPEPVNLAFGKEATQSSTHQGAVASRAVDGNGHGVYSHGSVSHTGSDTEAWWQVDLGEVAEITEVVIWNRTDSNSGRLRNFHVLVSDVPFTSTRLAATRAQAGVGGYHYAGIAGTETRIPIGRTARHVRVQLEERNYLHLAEVEVFSLLDYVGQPTNPGLDADVFVDGYAAHQAPGPRVGFDGRALFTYEARNTGDVTLYGLYVWHPGVGGATCPTRKLYPGELVVCEVEASVVPGEHSFNLHVEAWTGSGARVVDSPAVHYRVEGGGPPGLVNVALGKDARQAEKRNAPSAHPASLAVDGNLDGDLRNGSVSMTYRVVEAYWEVDLGEVYEIDSITLWNRTDCCSNRLRNFHVIVSDDPFELEDLEYTRNQPGVLDIRHRGTAGRRTDLEVGRTGRYVRIQAAYREAMIHLAEVQVWGTAAGDIPVEPPPLDDRTEIGLKVLVNGEEAGDAPGPVLEPGAPVTFSYLVTNTGTETLWAVYLWDDAMGRIACPSRRLDPGAAMTCEAESTARIGRYVARAEVNGWDRFGKEAFTVAPVHYLGTGDGTVEGAALDLRVLVEGERSPAPPGPGIPVGGPVSFTYEVSNIGTERLWSLQVWHDGVGRPECPGSMLEVGESITCTLVAAATAGSVTADVFANAWDARGTRATDSDRVAYTGTTQAAGPALSVVSLVNGVESPTPPGVTVIAGRAVDYTYRVTNTGTRQLWALWLWDREHGTITCPQRSLVPGETVTCSVTATPDRGLHSTTVLAEAWDAAGARAAAGTRHHYFVATEGASAEILALVDGINGWWEHGPRIRLGQTITRSFVVTNTGTVPLTGVRVTDDIVGDVTCPRDTVLPGESLSCAITQYTRLGRSITHARFTADAGGKVISGSQKLEWHVKTTGRNEDISLDVTVNGQATPKDQGPQLKVGSTAQLRYVVTNLGTWTSFYDITIVDPLVPMRSMSCTNTREVYLGSVVCTANVKVAAGRYSQVIVANAFSANTPRMQATAWMDWTGVP